MRSQPASSVYRLGDLTHKKVHSDLAHTGALRLIEPEINSLGLIISKSVPTKAIDKIKLVEMKLSKIAGANRIKSRLSKARRFMKKAKPKRDRAIKALEKALKYYVNEISWRSSANRDLSQGLAAYDVAIRDTIGLRLQERLTEEQAEAVASCQSIHRDISLYS